MKDLVYIYDKINFNKSVLGEVQRHFNLSFVIDGTKDSAKILVHNFDGKEVEPYSIIKHEATNTWWIVSHDRVDRYANETNYHYVHELELLGAIELLNARDLTDCGFNQNRYTIRGVIERLLKLSTFVFNSPSQFTINSNNAIDLDKQVDYVKTFENYTLLSALREFIDGYNCSIKLTFNERNDGTLNGANFNIISKTGNNYGTTYSENDFNNVEEVKTMDKNSFGTSVVSNAENVISTKTKTYPSSGAVRITGTAYNIEGNDDNTACIRLPSNIFKVNWVDFYRKLNVIVLRVNGNDKTQVLNDYYYPFSDRSIDDIYERLTTIYSYDDNFLKKFPKTKMKDIGKLRFHYTDKYDGIADKFSSDYYIPIRKTQAGYGPERQTVLSNIELKRNVKNVDDVFCFERGKDTINNFTFFTASGGAGYEKNSAFFSPTNEGVAYFSSNSGIVYYLLIGDVDLESATYEPTLQTWYLPDMAFVVNYIPMSDIKIKVDNTLDKRDSQFFNQNGKLTDSNALSKMLLSHSREIQSDNITKNAIYYFENNNGVISNNIPSVGSLVYINNEYYVINNVSMTFNQNEVENLGTQINYFVNCEFTLSKNVAVKSLMTNPNQNIRDYGIPQNNNVKRKQLYRDFYELNHTPLLTYTTPYMPLYKALNLSVQKNEYQEHIGVIKLSFDNAYGGGTSDDGDGGELIVSPSQTWYYQLESTLFAMKKMLYEVIDFKDNNIIGYGSQTVWSGFNIKRILFGNYDLANTPISYVNDIGEVNGISIAFCTNEQLTEIYNDYIEYIDSENNNTDLADSNYNAFYSCFIPSEIYEGGGSGVNSFVGAKTKNEFNVEELDYNKDALEVPVFEYACQIDDSDDVLIGENIFSIEENDTFYLYSYVVCDKNKYNENNYGLLTIPQVTRNGYVYTLTNAVKFTPSTKQVDGVTRETIIAEFYDSVSYDTSIAISNTNPTYGNRIKVADLDNSETPFANKDLLLVKYAVTTKERQNITYNVDVMGSKVDGDIVESLSLTNTQTLVGASIKLKDGYLDDTLYKNVRISGNNIYYVLGGQNYNNTEAEGTLRIVKEVASSSGTVSVSGSENDGYMTTRVLLESGQTLTNVSATLGPQYKGDTPYGEIINVANKVFSYKIGGNTYNDTISKGEIYCVLETTSISTQDLHTSVSGNRGHGNYYYDIFLPESGGQYITNANIIPDDPSIGADDNTYIVSSERLDSSYWRITYRCGAFNSSAVVNAELWWRVNTPTTFETELSEEIIGSKDDGIQVWSITGYGNATVKSYGIRNLVLQNNYYQNASVSATIVSAVGGVIQYHFNCDTPELDMDATITYTKSSYRYNTDKNVYGNKTQEQVEPFTVASNETLISVDIINATLLNNNVNGAFATLIGYTSAGVITYRLGQTIVNEDVEATLTYTINDSERLIDENMLMLVKNMQNRNTDDEYELLLYCNYYKTH